MCILGRWMAAVLVAVAGVSFSPARGADASQPIRVGLIGLDTSHVIVFTKELNQPKPGQDLGVRIVAGFPGGSRDIPLSWERLPKYTEELRKLGVEIVDSIPALLPKVDAVMLESVDGRPHLEQARPVIAAGKPLFIDKPMAASLADALEIFRLAKAARVPCFSASSLRFSSGFQAVRNHTAPFGDVKRCVAKGPLTLEPHHPDLFWYGIHSVEILYTILGPGCETVRRVAPNKVEGVWRDGRIGVFEGGGKEYSAEVQGTQSSGMAGKYEGYRPLLVEVCKFFRTGIAPVDAAETLEILAFMEAADASKNQGGKPVPIRNVFVQAAPRD